MKYKLYCIKDTVVGNYSDPKLFVNEQSAVRYFDGLCAESKIAKDLQLYYLGEFDIFSGELSCVPCEFIKGGINE